MNLRRTFLGGLCAFGTLSMASIGRAQVRRDDVEGRFKKLDGFHWDTLPLKDAIKIVHGDGKRKLAVFSDPNCGHCKRIDRDLKTIGNVTVYVFLYPVLGSDSSAKSRNIWCSKNSAKSWSEWTVDGTEPGEPASHCDVSALQRNAELGRGYNIKGTPVLIFSDGTYVPGAIPAPWIEKLLAASERR